MHYENAHSKGTLMFPEHVMYTTSVEPKFIEHLIQHKGLTIYHDSVGKLVGTLDDVFSDHVALVVRGRSIIFDCVKLSILKKQMRNKAWMSVRTAAAVPKLPFFYWRQPNSYYFYNGG